jgi:hypothetical protein
MWRRWLAVLAVALSVIAVLMWTELAHPPIHDRHDHQSRAKHHAEQADAQPHKTFWQRTAGDPIAVFNLILVVFTGVLAASTIGLWLATYRLWQVSLTHADHMEQSVKAAQISAESAMTQAKASERHTNVAERTLTGLERPYVFVSQLGALHTPDLREVLVRYGARNFGRTPAIVTEMRGAFANLSELNPSPDYTIGESFTANHVVEAGSLMEVPVNFVFRSVILPNQVFYGKVSYTDIFRNEYTSSFIVRVIGPNMICEPLLDERFSAYDQYT